MKNVLRIALDTIVCIFILTTLVVSGFDLFFYCSDGKVIHTARFCGRICDTEFDTKLMVVGIEDHKVICNCEVKK